MNQLWRGGVPALPAGGWFRLGKEGSAPNGVVWQVTPIIEFVVRAVTSRKETAGPVGTEIHLGSWVQ
jgi:hypothetical protein